MLVNVTCLVKSPMLIILFGQAHMIMLVLQTCSSHALLQSSTVLCPWKKLNKQELSSLSIRFKKKKKILGVFQYEIVIQPTAISKW